MDKVFFVHWEEKETGVPHKAALLAPSMDKALYSLSISFATGNVEADVVKVVEETSEIFSFQGVD